MRTFERILIGLALVASPSLAEAQGPPPKAAEAPLRVGDTGPAVESLQRALNANLSPSPGLDVDGDFGEATRGAVVRFQRAHQLEPTGVADVATRKALGPPPAPTAEPAVPAPEKVNAEKPAKKPADTLDGPPFTTAAAWAILDGRTGAVLWGQSEDKSLEPASTTKMMTALIVARLARADPKVLDEVVTFSTRADQTPGSTSGVRSGEKVPVRELLYGLLLPSGNDAAQAFAEHFGGRLAPEPGATADPAHRFFAEMNRVAAEVGLRETHFENPHGLPSPNHRSSARDLARLARAVLAEPTLADVVATPRRGARLVDASGHSRDVLWVNTNKLLESEGYDGVKTGTTSGAGACLVASGRLGDDHLIVVVLGAQSSDARYVDARNLFRWAWRERGHRAQ